MDEISLRALAERAMDPEPPMGQLVANALRAGKKLRRRRIQGRIVLASAAAAIGVSLPAGYGSLIWGHPAGNQPPLAQARAGRWPVVYAGTPKGVTVFSTRTSSAEKVLRIRSYSSIFAVAITPDGRKVYAAGQFTGIVPIDTATNTKLKPIPLPRPLTIVSQIFMSPKGTAAYAIDETERKVAEIIPIDTASNTVLAPITTPFSNLGGVVFTPDGATAYVVGNIGSDSAEVLPIRVATGTKLAPVTIGGAGGQQGVALTPDGKTLVVLNSVVGGPGNNQVTLINTQTNTASPPIQITEHGAVNVAIAPDGTKAYVATATSVIPIDIATGSALAPISLPASIGDPEDIAIAPSGTTMYVFATREIARIDIATGQSLPPIAVSEFEGLAGFARSPAGELMVLSTWHGMVAVNLSTGAAGPYADINASSNFMGSDYDLSMAVRP